MGAVDIGDSAALPAHDVVMVVADPQLKQRRRTSGFDPPHDADVSQRSQNVVHGLRRHGSELIAHVCRNAIDL